MEDNTGGFSFLDSFTLFVKRGISAGRLIVRHEVNGRWTTFFKSFREMSERPVAFLMRWDEWMDPNLAGPGLVLNNEPDLGAGPRDMQKRTA